MDFKQETDFREADRRYAHLVRQRQAGSISEEDFEVQRQRLMVLDGEGGWWSKSPEGGHWQYHDGSVWIRGTPPSNQETTPEPMATRTQIQERRPVSTYDRGQRHMKAGEWLQALECFEEVQLLESNYRETQALRLLR